MSEEKVLANAEYGENHENDVFWNLWYSESEVIVLLFLLAHTHCILTSQRPVPLSNLCGAGFRAACNLSEGKEETPHERKKVQSSGG